MSRYPKPGSVITGLRDERYWEPVFVLGTSRHTTSRFTKAEALPALVDAWSDQGYAEDCPGRSVVDVEWMRWNSVTRADVENGEVPDGCDEGGWHSEGTGSAFVDVAYPILGPGSPEAQR